MGFFDWLRGKAKKQPRGRTLGEIIVAVMQDLKEEGQDCPPQLIDHIQLMAKSNFSDQAVNNALTTSNKICRRQIQKLLLAFGKLAYSAIPYAGPPLRDLTQEQVVEKVKEWVLFGDVAEAHVQTGVMLAAVLDSDQVAEIHASQGPLTLQDLPFRWAVHCLLHGARPQILK